MSTTRTRDRLVGAAIGALVVLVLLVVAGLGLALWLSSPADEPGPVSRPPTPPAPGAGVPQEPDDLAEGETWFQDLALDAGTVATPDARLLDVQATGQDVLTDADGILAGYLVVDATVPFDVVAAEMGAGSTVAAGGSASEASVTREVEVAGRRFDVVASGTVDVVGGRLLIEPTTIDVGGPAFLANALGALARELVTVEHTIEGIPEGLVLLDVEVQPDGFRASLQGEDVRLVS